MRIKYDTWKKQLIVFSDNTKGDLKIIKTPSFGYGADYLTATINYKKNEITLLQSAVKISDEADLSPLEIEYCKPNSANLKITINLQDFFDKIFSGGSITSGNEVFDKKFTIKSSDSQLALSLFKEDRVQKLFLENSLLIFNVATEKGETTLKMKNMAKKLYTEEEMLYYLEEFKFIVNKIFE